MNEDNKTKGTGRTVGLMLLSMGQACLARGAEVEFVDHYPHGSLANAALFSEQLKEMASACGLKMQVRAEGDRVFIRSANI